MQNGTVTSQEVLSEVVEYSYVLLQPKYIPPRSGQGFGRVLESDKEVLSILPYLRKSKIIALDYETKGNDYSLEETAPVGIGLAWDTGSAYIPITTNTYTGVGDLYACLDKHTGLIGHNVYFDGGIARKHWGKHLPWHSCTYALFCHLANEGWIGQKHSLETAQRTVLLWPESNKDEMAEWLVQAGHYIGNTRKDESPEHLLEQYNGGKIRPDKSQMWQAPLDVISKYCILDAESTYLLYVEHLAPCAAQWPPLQTYHHTEFMHHIIRHIDQKIIGIPLDREGTARRRDYLHKEIGNLTSAILAHPVLVPHLLAMREVLVEELRATEPERYLKRDPEPKEPKQFKKDGSISKNYLNWQVRYKEWSEVVPQHTKPWIKWKLRMQNSAEDPELQVNLNSGPQMRELLYERAKLWPEEELGPPILTDSGLPSTGSDALQRMGEVGKLLVEKVGLAKELSYVEEYLAQTELRDTLHPNFRMPGPCTGRLSSNNINMQQVPKTKAMLSLFKARLGEVWVDLDYAALESMVAAEFSQDENLLRLYGPGVVENDIHCLVGSLVPAFATKFRATGYDPYNPPPGSVSRAKKECKKERGLAKTAVYLCQYNGGKNRLHASFQEQGVEISKTESDQIHDTYWRTFGGLKEYNWDLVREWQLNGGFILNGIGRPMAVHEDYKKDLLSRMFQSTGHDLLIKYDYIVCRELDRLGIPWWPVLLDMHDASTLGTYTEYGEQVRQVMEWGIDEINRQMNPTVPLKGKAVIGTDLAECKEPEE